MKMMLAAAKLGALGLASGVALMGVPTPGQSTQNGPVTDSSAQASPVNATPKGPVIDSASQASPVPPSRVGAPSFSTGEAITVHLQHAIDSGRVKNGENIPGTLDAAVRTQGGSTLPAGTPVVLSVIATVPAGKLSAAGELSLQLLRVGNAAVFTDTQTFRGKPGHRDLPDAAATVGTDAGLPAGAKLTFHVQPPPSFDVQKVSNPSAGAVNGVASGQAPPKNSAGGEFEPGATQNAKPSTTQNGTKPQ
jgi:hypothetical protein